MTGPLLRPNMRVPLALAAGLLIAVLLGACGSEEESPPAPDYEGTLQEAPPRLAQLYANGDELITGGEEAFDATLEGVRGYPVVVNNWASWCGPCRTEFPWLQRAAAEHLDEVAFLGINSEDSPEAYETFLRENPIPYPSVEDPDKKVAEWTGATLVGGLPNTLFYDREGELLYAHQGVYASEEDFKADLEKYALGEAS